MNHDEIRRLAIQTYNALPKPPDGVVYVLIAVEPATGAYQPVVSTIDATYLIGLLQRCIVSVDRAVHEAGVKAPVNAEDIQAN